MTPWLSHCSDELFTAYDPPSALTVATAPVPHISYSNHPWTPLPSPTLNPKAGQKISVKASVPVPASVPILDEPKATATAASTPLKQKGSDPGPQPNDPGNSEERLVAAGIQRSGAKQSCSASAAILMTAAVTGEIL